jgi:hypothetical protein
MVAQQRGTGKGAGMKLIVSSIVAAVSLALGSAATAGPPLHANLQATAGWFTAGHISDLSFSGTGVLPGIGSFSFSGEESEGCPYGEFCTKGYDITLTAANGDTIHLSGSWSVNCLEFDPTIGQFVSTGACDAGLPDSVDWTATGTGRFAKIEGSGSISSTGTAYSPPGASLSISLSGSLR